MIVLTDGDGTYPAECRSALVAQVLEAAADMAVGARQPTPGAGAMTLTRGLGNQLIRAAFWLLIGPGNTDLLSGYRAFSQRFRTTVQLRSSGFEIETELASEAVARRLRVVEIPDPLPSADRRHREQAEGVSRRPADPGHDRASELAASSSSAAPGVGRSVLVLASDGSPGVRGDRRTRSDRALESRADRHPGTASRGEERPMMDDDIGATEMP